MSFNIDDNGRSYICDTGGKGEIGFRPKSCGFQECAQCGNDYDKPRFARCRDGSGDLGTLPPGGSGSILPVFLQQGLQCNVSRPVDIGISNPIEDVGIIKFQENSDERTFRNDEEETGFLGSDDSTISILEQDLQDFMCFMTECYKDDPWMPESEFNNTMNNYRINNSNWMDNHVIEENLRKNFDETL